MILSKLDRKCQNIIPRPARPRTAKAKRETFFALKIKTDVITDNIKRSLLSLANASNSVIEKTKDSDNIDREI